MKDGASALKELVEKCKEGDERAWHDLLDRISPIIFVTCKRKKLTREQTFDIMGQVSLQLVINIGKMKNPDAIVSYVRTITSRQIFDLFRKSKHDKAVQSELELSKFVDIKNNPDNLFERKEQEDIIHEALLSLPKKDYRLLHALFLDKSNPSYEMISKRLGMPVSSIGPSRARSLNKLYKALKKRKFIF